MLDNRVYTFLELCNVMNYRKTAENLNMTQPAVTQHIHYLEREYGCKLFSYDGKILTKTESCLLLERYLRSVVYNEQTFRNSLNEPKPLKLSIGATKTIGDYTMEEKVMELLKRSDINLEFIIDNTDHLLSQLDNLNLDLLLVEGFVDKSKYETHLIKNENLVGICSPNHPFANKKIPLEKIFSEHIILREMGSGTRAVFDQFLYEKNHKTEDFVKSSVISSFKLIEKAVSSNLGISFVYQSILEKSNGIAKFEIKDEKISHELNFVFLKNSFAKNLIKYFL